MSGKLTMEPSILFLKTRSLYIAQSGLNVSILLPQPPEYRDDRCAPPCPPSNLPYLLTLEFEDEWFRVFHHVPIL
jgi:hypothetical protein